MINEVSQTVSTQIKELEENLRTSNTELAQAVVRVIHVQNAFFVTLMEHTASTRQQIANIT